MENATIVQCLLNMRFLPIHTHCFWIPYPFIYSKTCLMWPSKWSL